jgi:hypothetical protein
MQNRSTADREIQKVAIDSDTVVSVARVLLCKMASIARLHRKTVPRHQQRLTTLNCRRRTERRATTYITVIQAAVHLSVQSVLVLCVPRLK